jgi:hypothetical protein
VDQDIPSFVLDLRHFVDAQRIEQHFLLPGKLLPCQSLPIDIHKSMVIAFVFFRDYALGDIDDKEISISIGEFLCRCPAFGGGDESEHFNEVSCLQQAEVPLFQFGSAV